MNDYRTDFIVIPADIIAWNSEESKIEIIHDIHEKLLSNLVNMPGFSYDEFIQTFKSYEEIETSIDDEALDCLVFSSFKDAKLTYKEIFSRVDIINEVMVSNFKDDGEELKFEKVKDEISKIISNVIPNSSNQVD